MVIKATTPQHSRLDSRGRQAAGIQAFETPGPLAGLRAVLMELGLWRIETRHKLCALRLLRDTLIGDSSSQLRAIDITYPQCCVALDGPLGHGAPGLAKF